MHKRRQEELQMSRNVQHWSHEKYYWFIYNGCWFHDSKRWTRMRSFKVYDCFWYWWRKMLLRSILWCYFKWCTFFFKMCPVCTQEKLAREGEETSLLSDPRISKILTTTTSNIEKKDVVLQHLLEVNEGGVHCWMCFECSRALEWHVLPKLAIANNLWIGDVPYQLLMLTILEQLLIARW